jgi:hypothetical protein
MSVNIYDVAGRDLRRLQTDCLRGVLVKLCSDGGAGWVERVEKK